MPTCHPCSVSQRHQRPALTHATPPARTHGPSLISDPRDDPSHRTLPACLPGRFGKAAPQPDGGLQQLSSKAKRWMWSPRVTAQVLPQSLTLGGTGHPRARQRRQEQGWSRLGWVPKRAHHPQGLQPGCHREIWLVPYGLPLTTLDGVSSPPPSSAPQRHLLPPHPRVRSCSLARGAAAPPGQGTPALKLKQRPASARACEGDNKAQRARGPWGETPALLPETINPSK